ncbi:hypothetical protein EPN44_09230 [bacterium]|nr:MAG: hypothetical protein EPN44_09230 [bacterium]
MVIDTSALVAVLNDESERASVVARARCGEDGVDDLGWCVAMKTVSAHSIHCRCRSFNVSPDAITTGA